MNRTVKFRPDQPLFTARSWNMPLWLHMPWELMRAWHKWLFVSLNRDNPHRDPLHNATFLKPAKAPHKLGYWSGQPITKGAKWRTMAWRWGMVFTVLIAIKYVPAKAWWWLATTLGSMLKWVGLVLLPWCWAHLLWVPVLVGTALLVVWVGSFLGRRFVGSYQRRKGLRVDTPWYVYVLAVRDQLARWIK